MTIKRFVTIFLCALLCACANAPQYNAYLSSYQQELTYPKSVQAYQDQAELTDDPLQKKAFLLKMAGRLIQDGQPTRASQYLASLNAVTLPLLNEKYLLEAKLALLKKRTTQALRFAAKIQNPAQMPLVLQQFYHQLLADAYHLKGATINEVGQLIELDNRQQHTMAHLTTRRNIWRALSSLPLPKEKAIALEAQGELEGWLSLNLTAKELRDDSNALVQGVLAWQKQHPNHPANDIVKINQGNLIDAPTRLALLLPLSGRLSGPGQAIRDGVMASYFEAKKKGATVRFYDTNGKDVKTQYESAINDGAQFIIGPLTKKNVQLIANATQSVPTLALNDIDRSASNNFYRFSVDPQNEARQLAYRVHADGQRRALVIAPKGTWGESIANAFNQNWQQLNGELADTFYFDSKTDVNDAIRKLLGVENSHDRYNDLVRTLWKRPKFYARRRQDFDVIILLSYASMARQIRPMLNYYYAGNVPIYGTSLLYSGSPKPQQDVDLNGVIFGDMPYLLDTPKPLMSKSWPEQFNSYNRLFAMGKDAYLLSHQLNLLTLFPMMGVLDNTGTLFMDSQRQVIRQLEWAQFKNGLAKPLKTS